MANAEKIATLRKEIAKARASELKIRESYPVEAEVIRDEIGDMEADLYCALCGTILP